MEDDDVFEELKEKNFYGFCWWRGMDFIWLNNYRRDINFVNFIKFVSYLGIRVNSWEWEW